MRGSMEGKMNGLELFRNSLYTAAARSLQEKHPQYVETFMRTLAETRDFSLAIDSVKAMSTDVGFAKWRPLLTATLDTELAINRVRTNLDLLRIIPPSDILISEGVWVDYHLVVWVLLVDALLERTKKLVTQAVRILIRSDKTNHRAIQDDILKPINRLSKELREKIRNPLAHGGWAVDAPAEERLWEGTVLVVDKTISGQMFGTMAEYHAKWYEQLDRKAGLVLDEIDKAIGKLHGNIDWDET